MTVSKAATMSQLEQRRDGRSQQRLGANMTVLGGAVGAGTILWGKRGGLRSIQGAKSAFTGGAKMSRELGGNRRSALKTGAWGAKTALKSNHKGLGTAAGAMGATGLYGTGAYHQVQGDKKTRASYKRVAKNYSQANAKKRQRQGIAGIGILGGSAIAGTGGHFASAMARGDENIARNRASYAGTHWRSANAHQRKMLRSAQRLDQSIKRMNRPVTSYDRLKLKSYGDAYRKAQVYGAKNRATLQEAHKMIRSARRTNRIGLGVQAGSLAAGAVGFGMLHSLRPVKNRSKVKKAMQPAQPGQRPRGSVVRDAGAATALGGAATMGVAGRLQRGARSQFGAAAGRHREMNAARRLNVSESRRIIGELKTARGGQRKRLNRDLASHQQQYLQTRNANIPNRAAMHDAARMIRTTSKFRRGGAIAAGAGLATAVGAASYGQIRKDSPASPDMAAVRGMLVPVKPRRKRATS